MSVEVPVFVRDVAKLERPRERLLHFGADNVSNQELISILLGSGTRKDSVLEMSTKLLNRFETLANLKNATIEELKSIDGIGEIKAIHLLAAFELGKRASLPNRIERTVVKHPDDAAEFLMPDMAQLLQEHFAVLFLNVKNEIIHKQTIFIGSLNASIVHPREIFREAVKRSAASIICAHNHPSGNPTPSPEDIEVTKRIAEAGLIIGIDLLDHIIIGDHKYISMKGKGFF
ncbi:UPF0758 protein YsxA [Kurthia zopfii]|uniref:DNA repair protein RadC n=1 Tax=Kurthia zopfii TaxID=1650 RepID=A0A2U3AHH8_9BACL|nr:DNA repair protein RadC [Kurthia zopfii]PWI23970.1 hypothetical protein DF281_00295 [Kurthia zopfii]TDR44221.1 DNA replication and repair protein RadC [Kurthia zopfii]STX10173.1 DNA repair protein RadC [Kurthia zopfii]VEI07984.1 DNA repair protein RadC [Kurthia zopfii]GEK29824.1 UPF0758 protein YsxA [Kurthia zopfii]